MNDREEKKDFVEIVNIDYIVKASLAILGTLVSAGIIGIWTTVNNSSTEIIRLQSKLNSVSDSINSNSTQQSQRFSEITDRLTKLENRFNSLEIQILVEERNSERRRN